MRLLLFRHIKNARHSLRRNLVRSLLTMVGVTIGVASVTAVLALGSGANRIISNQIDDLGGNIAIIKPGNQRDIVSDIAQGRLQTDYTTGSLDEEAVEILKNVEHVTYVAPIMVLTETIKTVNDEFSNSTIVATTPDFNYVSCFKLRNGQFIDDNLSQDTAVLGTQLSIDMFGTESSIGRTLKLDKRTITVVGVLDRVNEPINYNLIDVDNSMFVNLSTGKRLNQNSIKIQQINVKLDSIENLDKTVSEMHKVLLQQYTDDEFSILTGDDISQPTNKLFYIITGFTTVIATISLVVGGIGIMNIMLVTVAERTREIGIRKAIGATNGDILFQFIIESMMISIIGGVFGYFAGYIVAFAIGKLLAFGPVINTDIGIIAIVISVFMGILFGLYPAIRAARKDPIESLHQYD